MKIPMPLYVLIARTKVRASTTKNSGVSPADFAQLAMLARNNYDSNSPIYRALTVLIEKYTPAQ